MLFIANNSAASARYDIGDLNIPSNNVIDSVVLHVFAADDGGGPALIDLNVFGSWEFIKTFI